jgi:hypothetical protein
MLSKAKTAPSNDINEFNFIGFSDIDISQSILLVVVVVLLIAILLLPSLKRVKIGQLEFETLETVYGSSKELESLSSVVSDLPTSGSRDFLKYARIAMMNILKNALELNTNRPLYFNCNDVAY